MGNHLRSAVLRLVDTFAAFSYALSDAVTRHMTDLPTVRPCTAADFESVYSIINDAAGAYEGIIPADVWMVPYIPRDELQREIGAGVQFWGFDEGRGLVGVMGLQRVEDVTLVRHAYVRTASQRQGIGGKLLAHVRRLADRPMLVGTWADAAWAIQFYQDRGFRLVTPEEKDQLLRRYWTVPERQIESSVVLADERWFARDHRSSLAPDSRDG